MLDICLLGTGGMMPLPGRWLTSMLARYNGSSLLIDAGEGTQIAIKEKGWSFNPIDIICFTHYHADHISGLPGLLLTIGNADRTKPITMIGPRGLEKVVNALRMIAPELPFEINFIELTEPQQEVRLNGYVINAFKVNHAVTCYGYSVSIERGGKFDANAARELGIPVNCWNRLQHGAEVEIDGKIFTPDMVLGPARKGIKVTYCTDSRPTDSIVENAAGSDLFICEGMYGEPDKVDKAVGYKHMTMYEAAQMAAKAGVNRMWLTHYSPSLVRPMEYINDVRKIFAESYICKDGWSAELDFVEE